MYFPYLRGKQYEVLAVRESDFLSNGRIVPVFEPTTDTSLQKTHNLYQRLARKNIRFSVIVNSGNGKPPPPMSDTISMVKDIESVLPGFVIPAFEIRAGQRISRAANFSSEFASQQCIFVHQNHTFALSQLEEALVSLCKPAVHIFLDGGVPDVVINGINAARKVLLRDGFQRRVPNASYPQQSYFDDLVFRYESRGYDGFADFSIIGDYYSSGGGPAKHVAIHLTELVDNTAIVTNHFVSGTSPQRGDVPAKYFDALAALVSKTGWPLKPNFDTQGVREYHQSNSGRHFPGLGKLNQWSIMHHMEIIDKHLQAIGTSSFV